MFDKPHRHGARGHAHSHDHGHDHPDGHTHPHSHAPAPGHNGPPPEHLHSHTHGDGGRARIEELQALAASLIEGFRAASDKTSFLRVAGVPFQMPGTDGRPLYLLDATITEAFQLGTASPGFGTKDLSYLPYPGEMVRGRETMTLTYVSLSARVDRDILEVLSARVIKA